MQLQQQFSDEIEASGTNDLKAISAENRRVIIKSLKDRRKTLSELSRVLGIKPSSAKQHLSILEESGFVKQMDEGRKWKYYELTDKGKKLFALKEQNISVLLVFASAIFVLAFAVYLFSMASIGSLSAAPTASDMKEFRASDSLGAEKAAGAAQSITAKPNEGSTSQAQATAPKEQAEEKPSFDFTILAAGFILACLASFAIGFLFPKMKNFLPKAGK